jgi:sulfite exporter TauE/SafE
MSTKHCETMCSALMRLFLERYERVTASLRGTAEAWLILGREVATMTQAL